MSEINLQNQNTELQTELRLVHILLNISLASNLIMLVACVFNMYLTRGW